MRKLCLCAATAVLASAPVIAQVSPQPAPQQADSGNAPSDPLPPRGQLSAISAYQGLTVESIAFRGVASEDEERLRRALAQKPGEILDRAKVRSSIQALYATGKFSSITVEAERGTQDQIRLVFIASENYFNGAITVEGLPKSGPTANQLANASKLELGELFTTEKLEQSFDRMQKVLQDYGYYQATITAEEQRQPETQQINILFRVVIGPIARVGEVRLSGDPGYSLGQVQDIAKLHPGDKVRPNAVTRALQRLRKKYQKQNRLEAHVAVVERKYNREPNTVDYTFHVDRGPTVDIHAEGAKVREGLLRRYVPIYEESAVDDDLLTEGRRNLLDYFQTKGYFDARIDFKREAEPTQKHLHVIYDIDLGERHKLDQVRIEGNRYFSTELIRERMEVQPAGWLLSHGRYSQSLLARDVQAIASLYQANGFQQVKVTSNVQDDYRNQKGQMRIVINIEEGPQTRVNTLVIKGSERIPEDDLRGLLTTIEGQPFSEVNLATDRESVLNHYFNLGFPDVEIESAASPHDNNPASMDVVYTIKEGEQWFVDRVLVGGLEHTRPHIVNRELLLNRAAPLSQLQMLDSQRRLYNLGIFNEVNMAIQNPEGEAPQKNVVYQFTEAKRYTFNYGFGIEISTGADQGQGTSPQGKTGVSPRVSFDVTRINFRGRDQSIIFKSRVGRLQQRVLLSFDSPRWFDMTNWRWTISAFFDNSRDVNTFASERLEGSTQLEQVIGRDVTMLYRFSYRRVKVDPNSFPVNFDRNTIPLFSRPVRVGIPSITFLRDRRDDPINSTKGTYNSADLGIAANFFGSEANFGRLLLQNSTFHTFKKKYVFARSTRIGVESPWGNAEVRFVPLPERFFAGGGNSHRGFAINQAGPRDANTGSPLGGNAMFVNNLELRLPPVTLPFVQQNLSFVLFHDMGNVFSEAGEMWKNIFKYSQDNASSCRDLSLAATCDFNYVSHAIGTGIRYRTPIGPIRVDLGYNLNPPTFPIKQANGTTPAHSEVVRKFNVFFSIGQTF